MSQGRTCNYGVFYRVKQGQLPDQASRLIIFSSGKRISVFTHKKRTLYPNFLSCQRLDDKQTHRVSARKYSHCSLPFPHSNENQVLLILQRNSFKILSTHFLCPLQLKELSSSPGFHLSLTFCYTLTPYNIYIFIQYLPFTVKRHFKNQRSLLLHSKCL